MRGFWQALPHRIKPPDSGDMYDRAMHGILDNLDTVRDFDGKLALLDAMIRSIHIDIRGTCLTDIIYGRAVRRLHDVFPLPIACCCGKQNILFTGNTVLSELWDWTRFAHAAAGIAREGFQPNKNDTTGNYYPELKLLVITNGKHHSAIASLSSGQGVAKAEIYSLAKAFPFFIQTGAFGRIPMPMPRRIL